MHSLTGTWRLVRLALRRDRIKLPVVLVVLSLLFVSSAGATANLYHEDSERIAYASTTASSVVARVFGGPISGPDLGAIVLNETFLFTAIAVAFMSTLTVIRHTRQNEEFGRSELIESGIVSRHASLAAALIVAALSSAIFGIFTAVALLANDLPVAGSVATGAAMTGVGISFALVAAVMAQLADSSRGANSFCALAIGVAFLLRGVGDGIGSLTAGGMAVNSAFLSWLSPIGWGQQIHPFTEQNWWVFGLFGVLILALAVLSISFTAKRDIGLGMIPARLGRAKAKPSLLSPFGLASRLQKGILRGWAAAVVVLGVTYGAVVKEFENIIQENEQIAEAFAQVSTNVTEAFLSVMIGFMAITIAGYGVQAILRMRSEEANGQLESVLATSVSRSRWLLSHVSFIFMGLVLLSILTALSVGITFVLTSGESWSWLWIITQATLVQSVAALALAAFIVALFSLLPRLSVAVGWGAFAACLLILQFSVILELPQWLINLSPFGHLPPMPAEPFELAPLLGLCLASAALVIVGLSVFHRRDVITV